MQLSSLLLSLTAASALAATYQAPLLSPPLTHQHRDPVLPSSGASELLYLHRKLVETESITGNERDVGDWLAAYLVKNGLSVEKQEVSKNRYNILAYPGKDAKTDVLVTSHIDTVPPFWPYKLKHNDTQIWGRGSVDAKACVAAQTIAVLSLLNSSSSHPIPSNALSLLFVVGEETSGDGMIHFSTHKPTNYTSVIFGEPTEGKLAAGHKGMLGFHIKIKGKAAHSGYPWLGISANNMMIEALSILLQLEKSLPSSDLYGKSTLNVGKITGGVAANVVAEFAEAEVAIRVAAGLPAAIQDGIVDVLADVKQRTEDSGGAFDIVWNARSYGPVDMDTDIKGFESITVNYGTDVPNLEGDHKRYLYGPGSILVAHSDHEHLTVAELEQAVVDYQKIILAVLEK